MPGVSGGKARSKCATPSSRQFKLSEDSQVAKCKTYSETFKPDCILSCCKSCSICNFTRASTKERCKTRCSKNRNKVCQRCFFCKSLSFCQICSKCPQCCHRAGCRGQTSKVLAEMGNTGSESKGGLHLAGRLHTSVQDETPTDQISSHHKWLCKSGKKSSSLTGSRCLGRKVGGRKGSGADLPILLQPPVPGPKTRQQVASNLGSQSTQSFSQNKHIQDGNTGDHQGLLTKRGMGHVSGFQRRLLSHPHPSQIQKIPQVLFEQQGISVHSPSFRTGHCSTGIYQGGQRGEIDGSGQGYKNPPVPRRLVAQSPGPGNLPTKYPDPLGPVPRVWLGGKHEEIRAGTSTKFQFCRLPVRSPNRTGVTHRGALGDVEGKTALYQEQGQLHRQTVNVSHRSIDSNRETGVVRSPTHATNPRHMHLKRHWHVPEILDKEIPVPPTLHPHLDWWLEEKNVLCGQPLHPLRHALQVFTDASNEGWGTHLGDYIARGVWSEPKSRLHINFLELKAVFLALKSFEHLCRDQIVLVATDNTTVVSYINKEGGMRSGSLCALLWRLLSWCHPKAIILRARHIPGRLNVIADKLSRHNQVIQTEWSLSQQVFRLLFSNWALPQLDLFATRFNHKQVCVTGSGSDSLGCRRPQHIMGKSGCVRLSPSCIAQSSGFKSHGPGVSQNGANCTRLAQHGLVLGSGDSVRTNPFPASTSQGSGDSTCQWPPTQESRQSKPTCMAPQASIIQEQGFADEVAARIEAPQRSSTRAVYKSRGTIFVKWCDSHKVDFRSPSVNQIADFLLYLFKDRKLQPSTIDGYRTAIADMVGNQEVNISKDENLTRLLDSFHRDKPKGRRAVPSWNLSLVLHQLTKAPFEPMRKASLKHLTFKTVFLLALGSGKRRSEIHAWLFKNIRHQESWSQVSLYTSPMFISKNQLAREGPTSVAPVVIPALAPSLDRDLKEDRSLCPVRALRYYLDRTKDLRKGKELVFVSFRKSF